MIDLLDFFKKNYSMQPYYAKHAPRLIRSSGSFLYTDTQEVVDRLRAICQPDDLKVYDSNNDEFLLISFWLHEHGYRIKEFPNVLSRPDSLRGFAYDDMRSYIWKHVNSDSTVRWQERRILCRDMSITTNVAFQLMPSEIEGKIRLISTRGAEFDSMTLDEQLQNLNNLIENLLKPSQNGSFLSLNYDEVFFGYISEDDVKRFRKQTHPFRHATEDTLQQRATMSEAEKLLLSQLGVFIARHLYQYLDEAF